MKYLFSLLLFLSVCCPALALDELISDFEGDSVPVLNEELRKISGNIDTVQSSVDTNSSSIDSIDTRVTALEAGGSFIDLGDRSELTISSGEITVTTSFHLVDTESDAASDDLDTINGGSTGCILVLGSAASARDTTIKNSASIRLAGNADFVLTDTEDQITLIRGGGSNWIELSRSDNS